MKNIFVVKETEAVNKGKKFFFFILSYKQITVELL